MQNDRRDLRRRLFKIASSQRGYFSASQAKEVGYSYQAQAYHANAGNWMRVDRGIFMLADWPPEPHGDLVRWTLWSRGRAVVSYPTALAVHELGEFESASVHITVPSGFSMRARALAIHPEDLPSRDIEERGGFRVTTPIRSLVDTARLKPDEDQFERAVAEALDLGLATPSLLRERAEEVDVGSALLIERVLPRAAV